MKTATTLTLTSSVLALAMAGGVAAQTPDFPPERVAPRTCADFDFDRQMRQEHQRVIDACQEVVVAEGTQWARFNARFDRVNPDRSVTFTVLDRNQRVVDNLTITPTPGQVAYIDDREVPFERLQPQDQLNLYAAEGRYGFSSRAATTGDQVARTPPGATAQAGAATDWRTDTTVAQQDRRATTLPRTASPMPWVALGGALSLLGGLGLMLRRRV
jgi:LPXTG-motif cell wall-anchored protein